MKRNVVKTTTLTAQMTVCKMETGMDHVQVVCGYFCFVGCRLKSVIIHFLLTLFTALL